MLAATPRWIKTRAGLHLLRAFVLFGLAAPHAVPAAETSQTAADLPFAATPGVPETWGVAPTLAVRADPEQRWYGWQPLLVDTAGQAFAVWSMSFARQYEINDGSWLVASIATYALVPPLIHAKHGHWGKAALDLLLRLSLPVVGGLPAVWTEGRSDGIVTMAAISFVAGMGAAIAIDAAVLSKEPMPAAERAQSQLPPNDGWTHDRGTDGTGARF